MSLSKLVWLIVMLIFAPVLPECLGQYRLIGRSDWSRNWLAVRETESETTFHLVEIRTRPQLGDTLYRDTRAAFQAETGTYEFIQRTTRLTGLTINETLHLENVNRSRNIKPAPDAPDHQALSDLIEKTKSAFQRGVYLDLPALVSFKKDLLSTFDDVKAERKEWFTPLGYLNLYGWAIDLNRSEFANVFEVEVPEVPSGLDAGYNPEREVWKER